jgi:EAL domain-containing protein (putative c-di-GMP-specific phosphodiesterase class I)
MVTDIDTSSIKQALVEAIVGFSARIGIKVIAEGIERHQELEHLKSIGVDYGQGYLLGRPSPAPANCSDQRISSHDS